MSDIKSRLLEMKYGRTVRKSYARLGEVAEMPNLIEVQKNSYQWFLETGLKEVFREVAAITDYSGNLELRFCDYTLEHTPKYSVEECKERDATYAAPLKVRVRLRNKETEEIKEQEIFMGDFPLMTPSGTFVINGAERVIISQIVRSPGVYFNRQDEKSDVALFASTIIPYRGAWLEYETDLADVFYVRIDKNRKLPITALIRAVGVSTNAAIKEMFGEDKLLLNTLDKDPSNTEEESLIEIYRRIRPGEPPTEESARALLNGLFFDPRRYDLSNVGRYKFNKKLALAPRLAGRKLARPISDPDTGEVLVEAGETLSRERAVQLENRGVFEAWIIVENDDHSKREVKIFSNRMVDMSGFVEFDPKDCGIREKVRYSVLKSLLNEYEGDALIEACTERIDELVPKHITQEDILSSINYMLNLCASVGNEDDIDHLGNRRLRRVGELLQNQFRIGFARMERVIRERMTIQDAETVTPQSLINIRPVTAAIKEFFGSSPLSQFMDQNNPLAELTHKRRMSALGPGGLTRERASFEVRDVHYSHYGRMCPIETPEGPNVGLISYLSTFAKINEFGFIEAPYRKYDHKKNKASDSVTYMTADVEDDFIIAQANELDENGRLKNARVSCRHRNEIIEVEPERVDYIDISPKMMVSVATSMIPFLENDDCGRALMGSNMQKQAVPLLSPESPIVATGMEFKAGIDAGVCVLSEGDGTVTKVSANEIVVDYAGRGHVSHKIVKFMRSNQGTCINQRPIVSVGDKVQKNDVLADGPSTCEGEISLGRNVLVGFMCWEGYNYEDAILLSERLVHDDVYTSIHIEEHETEARDTKLGPEEISRDIPNVGDDALKDLDERGVIRIGAEVRPGDILVGKVTPKGETELTAEERLLRAIFGEKAREVRDTSLRVPHGESGIIVDVKVFTRENGDELSPGVNMVVRCYIAQKRKISVGDKMAGRHGNKGVISRILPREDMPFLPDGTPLDVVLTPLGVPGRMNIGQILELHMGYAAKALNWKIATPVFDGANEQDIEDTLELAGLSPDGKSDLYDGRTGEKYDSPVAVGYSYFLKLHHLVDDKIHARSTGPYSLVTQQPLGGKAQFGGQRFGEMEVWALEAYGAAYTLQEILTVKSDDITGRVKTYEAIVKGHNVPEPGIPESFKVLIKEMQSLGLDVRVLDKNMEEIELREDDEDTSFGAVERSDMRGDENEFAAAGYAVRDARDIDIDFNEDDEDDEDDDIDGLEEFEDEPESDDDDEDFNLD